MSKTLARSPVAEGHAHPSRALHSPQLLKILRDVLAVHHGLQQCGGLWRATRGRLRVEHPVRERVGGHRHAHLPSSPQGGCGQIGARAVASGRRMHHGTPRAPIAASSATDTSLNGREPASPSYVVRQEKPFGWASALAASHAAALKVIKVSVAAASELCGPHAHRPKSGISAHVIIWDCELFSVATRRRKLLAPACIALGKALDRCEPVSRDHAESTIARRALDQGWRPAAYSFYILGHGS